MGRKSFTAAATQLKPDPRYGDPVLARFINCVMSDGKKATAQRVALHRANRRHRTIQQQAINREITELHLTFVEMDQLFLGAATAEVVIIAVQHDDFYGWILTDLRKRGHQAFNQRFGKGIARGAIRHDY